jgi:hypothetical protein
MSRIVREARRYLAPATLAIVIAVAVTVGVARARGGVPDPVSEPWPAFTMTWRETANNLGWNGTKGTQAFRLEYTDRHHFRVTMIENSALPQAIGATWAFDGTTSTFHDPRRDKDEVHPYGPDEATVPSEWLVPGRTAFLLTQPGYVAAPVGNGLGLLRYDETLPSGKVSHEETTYRLADLIPVSRVITVNGVEVRREEVIEFRLGTP